MSHFFSGQWGKQKNRVIGYQLQPFLRWAEAEEEENKTTLSQEIIKHISTIRSLSQTENDSLKLSLREVNGGLGSKEDNK